MDRIFYQSRDEGWMVGEFECVTMKFTWSPHEDLWYSFDILPSPVIAS